MVLEPAVMGVGYAWRVSKRTDRDQLIDGTNILLTVVSDDATGDRVVQFQAIAAMPPRLSPCSISEVPLPPYIDRIDPVMLSVTRRATPIVRALSLLHSRIALQ